MDDLSSTIGSILGDPQKMEQLRAVAQSLGMGPGGNSAPSPGQANPAAANSTNNAGGGGFDPSAISSIIQNFQNLAGGGGNAAQNAPPQAGAQSQGAGMAGSLGAMGKIAEIFGNFNQSDKNVELLRSLRPHFSPARAGRIDDAVRVMQLIRAWPSLRDSGLLGSLGNLFGGGSK